jgi:hypothetical protein
MEFPGVEVGQRFQSVGTYQSRVWEVEDIYVAAHDVVHAKLRDVGDVATYRTIAPEALLDLSRFRPL